MTEWVKFHNIEFQKDNPPKGVYINFETREVYVDGTTFKVPDDIKNIQVQSATAMNVLFPKEF